MPCYHPLKAERSASGVRVLGRDAKVYNLTLPCGQCIGCRLERSRQWALRCMHEASLHDQNSFVTLTYDEAHLPPDLGLHHEDFQKFIKRLRRRLGVPVRYYMCGEYGSQRERPHFHALLFGVDFSDKQIWSVSTGGNYIYRSALLESLWIKGFSSIGAVTFESAAYVARYVMKKMTGADSFKYDLVDPSTGEVHKRRPEYNRMSLKPGIGAGWMEKYSSDVYPYDRVIHDGLPSQPPRYYDKLYARDNPEDFMRIKDKRVLDGQSRWRDNTARRLADKEKVKQAQISKLKRRL